MFLNIEYGTIHGLKQSVNESELCTFAKIDGIKGIKRGNIGKLDFKKLGMYIYLTSQAKNN